MRRKILSQSRCTTRTVIFMIYRKKYISAFLAGLMLISSTSCVKSGVSDENTEKVNANQENSAEQSEEKNLSVPEESSAESTENQTDPAEIPESDIQETQPSSEELTSEEQHSQKSDFLKGNIYDSNGIAIVYNRPNSKGEYKRVFADDYAIPFANVVCELSEGLDSKFENLLTKKNPSPVNSNENTGQSIQLTLDANIQSAIYNYMAYNNMIGSVVVMRTDGSLMAEVSYPSYDPEYFYENPDTNEDLAWGTYGNKAFQNAAPGSCFKIMSEVISDMNGIYSLWDEGVWTDDGSTVLDWDYAENPYYPMERSLYSAFINSSNIFFAKSFSYIGADTVLYQLNDVFHFGWGNDIECDFGTISNNIEIYCDDDLRRSAFGQSYVLTSPIYLASLGREALFGDMVTPFVLRNVVDTNNSSKIIESGTESYQILGTIPYEYRQNLLDGMIGVANNIGLYAPYNYNVYAKTGTAETDAGDILYITGGLRNVDDISYNQPAYANDYSDYWETGSYVIVMQIKNADYFGFDFASQSSYLYQGIINMLVGY